MDFPKDTRDKVHKDKVKHLKKHLSQYVMKPKNQPKDSKVKKGLFQKGFCTSHQKRTLGYGGAGRCARLNGNLDEIIRKVNGKVSLAKHDENKVYDDSLFNKYKTSNHNLTSAEDKENTSECMPSVQSWGSLRTIGKCSHDFIEENVKTPPGNLLIHNHKSENFPNTQAVKKARVTEYINSLPSIYEESVKQPPAAQNKERKPPSEGIEEFKEAHMIRCFDEHVSMICQGLVNLKTKRYGNIDYNAELKKSILENFKRLSGNSPSSSTSTYFSAPNETFKGPATPPTKKVNFKLSSNSRYVKEPDPASNLNTSMMQSSKSNLSPLVGDPMFGRGNSPPNSRASSLGQNLQPSFSPPVLFQTGNTQPFPPHHYSQSFESQLNSLYFPSYPANKHSLATQLNTEPSAPGFDSQPFSSQLSTLMYNSRPSSYDLIPSQAPQFYGPSMPLSHKFRNINQMDIGNSCNLTERERPMYQEPPQLSDHASFQLSQTPEFTYYPRNMF